MGKVVEFPAFNREVTGAELNKLYFQHPDLKKLLGDKYKVSKDRQGEYWVMDSDGDVDLLLELFVAIGRSENNLG